LELLVFHAGSKFPPAAVAEETFRVDSPVMTIHATVAADHPAVQECVDKRAKKWVHPLHLLSLSNFISIPGDMKV